MSNSSTNSARLRTANRWLATAAIVLACLVTAGLILGKRMWVRKNIHPVIQQRVDLMTERLQAQGATVGEPTVREDTPGIAQAVEILVNGKPITLIEFDTAQEGQAKELKHIHEDHKSKVLGTEKAAEDDGAIVIVGFEEHPSKEKVLEAFKK
jgi:hypothetical protein